jgi:peptidoglycan/xylan/chitin deacetylase (PgdA/CDA1 family)
MSIRKAALKLLKQIVLASRLNHLLVRIMQFPIVVGYHRVVDDAPSLLVRRIGSVSECELASHLAYFERIGCRIVNFEQAIISASSRSVAITFDDGFKDIHTNAFPILRGHKAPFSLFLITSLIGREKLLWQHELYSLLDSISPTDRSSAFAEAIRRVVPEIENSNALPAELDELLSVFMRKLTSDQIQLVIGELSSQGSVSVLAQDLYVSRQEIDEMIECGLVVESHGHEHWMLSRTTSEALRIEISKCAEVIECYFHRRPLNYAVAHGDSDSRIVDEIFGLGYQRVVTGRYGLVSDSIAGEVPRIWPRGSEVDLSWTLTRALVSALAASINRNIAGIAGRSK